MFDDVTLSRFWSKVDKRGPDECWPWLASCNNHRRGTFYLWGRNRVAPRVAWMIANRRHLPDGLNALHSCDNPNCVNPNHIRAGTQAENIKEAHDKGRRPKPPIAEMCRNGHKRTAENTRIKKTGAECMICRRASIRKHDKKRRATEERKAYARNLYRKKAMLAAALGDG